MDMDKGKQAIDMVKKSPLKAFILYFYPGKYFAIYGKCAAKKLFRLIAG